MFTFLLQIKKYLIWFKIAVLLVVWGVFTAFLMSTNEHVDELKLISVPKNGTERGKTVPFVSLWHWI